MRKSICSKAFSFLLMLFAFGLKQAAAQTTIGLTGTTQATCNGTPTGDITVNVTLDPFATTCDVKLDSAGVLLQTKPILISGNLIFSNVNAYNNYTVIATDDVGTTVNVTGINVTEPAAVAVNYDGGASNLVNKCKDSLSSLIVMNVTGTTYPYSYSWDTNIGLTDSIYSNAAAGNHTFTVVDKNGCQFSSIVTVTEPNALILSGTVTNSICNGLGSLVLSATGGTGSKKFLVKSIGGSYSSTTTYNNLTDISDDTAYVQDVNSCPDTIIFSIQHTDATPPVIVLKPTLPDFYLDVNGSEIIEPADIDGGTYDNCGIQLREIIGDTLICSDGPVKQIIFKVTDKFGNVSQTSFNVNVIDTIKPVLVTKTVNIGIDTSGKAVLNKNDIIVSATDNCNVDSTWVSQDTFFVGDVGTPVITVSVRDKQGNITTKTQIINVELLDSDNDSIPDYIEKNFDTDGDGTLDYLDTDSDNDGLADRTENNGKHALLDSDGDGIPDFRDLDSDNDGINDVIENGSTDANGDGINDNAGTILTAAVDTDMDGTPDYLDLDSDDDGLFDVLESLQGHTDADSDGIVDDTNDADADGIMDEADGNTSGFGDNGDLKPADADVDTNMDFRETDSDNDQIPDAVEGATDSDNDGDADYRDTDSDDDGISDTYEAGADPINPVDTDNDGKEDFRDTDSDGDTIPDDVEAGSDPANPVDTDNDGTDDFRDLDSDGDGISDKVEAGSDPNNPVDTDNDGIMDFRDIDSDGDGLSDNIEGTTDTDGNGIPDYIDAQYRIPEAFSPNGDGVNDLFIIKGLKVYNSAHLIVFNRNGQVIFDSGDKGYKNNWNGTNQSRHPSIPITRWMTNPPKEGEMLPEGLYYYVFKPNAQNRKDITGNIYIKR